MTNHEKGKKRPTYFTIKDNNIVWFIPIISKVDKYKNMLGLKKTDINKIKEIMLEELK